jgi:hypothetical protein
MPPGGGQRAGEIRLGGLGLDSRPRALRRCFSTHASRATVAMGVPQ